MVPSDGVAEPQREFWLVTQRTEDGTALPPRYFADRSAAWAARSASLRGRRRPDPRVPPGPLEPEFFQHAVHPFPFLGPAEGGGDGDHGGAVLPERGDGPASAGGPAHHHRGAVGGGQRRGRRNAPARPARGVRNSRRCCCHFVAVAVALGRPSVPRVLGQDRQDGLAVLFQLGRAHPGEFGQLFERFRAGPRRWRSVWRR